MACEMFWMVAEEPPVPEPKRRTRKAKAQAGAQPDAGFACDAPDDSKAKPAKPRATRAKRRSPRVESERQP